MKHNYSLLEDVIALLEHLNLSLLCTVYSFHYTLHMLIHSWPTVWQVPSILQLFFRKPLFPLSLWKEVGHTAGEASFPRNTVRQCEDLWLYHWPFVFCYHAWMPLRVCKMDTESLQSYRLYIITLSFYSFPHHSALDRNINLQHFFSSLFFLPVHCVHPNQVHQSTRCCLRVGCNTTCWPSGWHQTWRCETSPLGALVWLEQSSDIQRERQWDRESKEQFEGNKGERKIKTKRSEWEQRSEGERKKTILANSSVEREQGEVR